MSIKSRVSIITCGSVDDGKSTLIGRLLLGTHSVPQDILDKNVTASKHYNRTMHSDASLLVDGLEEERNLGITIDVAYRYFKSAHKEYRLADCPGHAEFTRNMITGASTADVAIILIDATLGVREQTKRHAVLCSLLNIKRVAVVVNKMDLVNWDETVFNRITEEFANFAKPLFAMIKAFPVSALYDVNVSRTSDNPGVWYQTPTLLGWLDTCVVLDSAEQEPLIFPIQGVVAIPETKLCMYYGTLATGQLKVGETLVDALTNRCGVVSAIWVAGVSVIKATAGDAVMITFSSGVKFKRGSVLQPISNQHVHVNQELEATLIWMDELSPSGSYSLKLMTNTIPVSSMRVCSELDIATGRNIPCCVDVTSLHLNDIVGVVITLTEPIAFKVFSECSCTSTFILIDNETCKTVAAGILTR